MLNMLIKSCHTLLLPLRGVAEQGPGALPPPEDPEAQRDRERKVAGAVPDNNQVQKLLQEEVS